MPPESREKRYRLLREGEQRSTTPRPALQLEERRGRILADAPQLREARKAAREGRELSTDELALVQIEVEIASNPKADPTDRFMAAELGTWTDRLTRDEALSLLGSDVLAIDLLRVPQNESKDRALEWALGYLEDQPSAGPDDPITLVSAVAAGAPWAGRALAAVSHSQVASRRVAEGFLGWAIPGAEETGPAKFPEDLETLERRIERAREALPRPSRRLRPPASSSALCAPSISWLPRTRTPSYRERLFTDIARLAWQARRRAASGTPPRLDDRGHLRTEALRVLIETSTRDDLAALEPAVRAAFRKRPNEYASVFEFLARSTGQDPAVKAMEVIRDVASTAGLRPMAAHAFAWGAANHSPALSEIASLAGTIAPDDQGVRTRLDQIAREHADAALAGDVVAGAAWFSAQSWAGFVGSLLQRIDDAFSRERHAHGRAGAADRRGRLARVRRKPTIGCTESRAGRRRSERPGVCPQDSVERPQASCPRGR